MDLLVETSKISDVEFEAVKTFSDQRGFFREAARIDKPFFAEGIDSVYQIIVPANSEKAFSYQSERTEWFYVPIGVVKVTLRDLRPSSPTKDQTMTFLLGENQTYMHAKIPAGVAYSFKAQESQAFIFFICAKGNGQVERVTL